MSLKQIFSREAKLRGQIGKYAKCTIATFFFCYGGLDASSTHSHMIIRETVTHEISKDSVIPSVSPH